MKPRHLELVTNGAKTTDTITPHDDATTAAATNLQLHQNAANDTVESMIEQECTELWKNRTLLEAVLAGMPGENKEHVEGIVEKVSAIFLVQLKTRLPSLNEAKVRSFLRATYLLEEFCVHSLAETISERHPHLAESDFSHAIIHTKAHNPSTGELLPIDTIVAHFAGENLNQIHAGLSHQERLIIKACAKITVLMAQTCGLTREDTLRFLTIARQIRDEQALLQNKQ